MNIFSRRELFLTRRTDDLNRVKERLTAANIEYSIRTNSLTNPGRYHGVVGVRAEYSYEYRVYVHKNDYERAKHIMRG